MGKNKQFRESFSDKLTPGQIRQILDVLNLPWREYHNAGNDGWINIPPHEIDEIAPLGIDLLSDLSVNIYHGGFQNQYLAEHPDPIIDEDPIRGDIVTLVAWLQFQYHGNHKRAISWIKHQLGFDQGTKPPDVPSGYEFANKHFEDKDKTFVRMPPEILGSSLSGNEKIVWAAIYSRCNADKIYSFPGTRKIAQDTGLSKPTVLRAIKHLKNYGLLIEKFRGHNKPPLRFPLIASQKGIDSKIHEEKK